MVEDDEEQMKEELKEAFRIYDKEVAKIFCWMTVAFLSNTILRFRDPMNSL